MEIYVDTQKLRNSNKDLRDNINKLNNLYEEMFNRLFDVQKRTHEIVGPGFKKYVYSLKNDKNTFMNYINDLNKYLNFLEDAARQYESLQNTIR